MEVVRNPLFSWEPAVITIFTVVPVDEHYLVQVREALQNALSGRDNRKECQCFQQYIDISQRGPNEVRVLCEWLCAVCLPKVLGEIEKNVPQAERFELGLLPKPDPFKSRLLLIAAKRVLFENGQQVFVQEFSISLREITVREFSTFCKGSQFKTVAEKQGSMSTYQSNFGLRDFSTEAKLDRAATYLSFDDAQAYCKWAGKRLPTEAEFLAAALLDNEIRKTYDPETEQMVRLLLAEGKLPSFVGANITSTVADNDSIVMRSGPKYVREIGWEAEERYQRHLRAKDYFDANTSFHVCEI